MGILYKLLELEQSADKCNNSKTVIEIHTVQNSIPEFWEFVEK